MDYDYDESAAIHADDFANRIDENALYIGVFKHADQIEATKGTKGIYFEFEVPGGGNAQFSLYTEKEDGTRIFGFNKVQALMTILGLKRLPAKEGIVNVFDADEGKRVEKPGMVYPDLCGKMIGCALQKELYTNNSGKDGFRMELVSFFHPDTKLTASEIRERKVKPEKLDRIARSLKTRDSRKKPSQEPAQPGAGAPTDGEY